MGRRKKILARIKDNCIGVYKGYVNEEGYQTACHIWQGADSGTGRGGGYPRMSLDGQTVAVHRVVYVCKHGYVPGKKQIDHKCENRMCVNPRHLQMVTHKKNQKLKTKRI